MTLKAPNLDDRTFQDIVREARSKIPLYCPKWTDYNLSDPGITLIELFAWMTDMLLYRLNRVPEKNYIKFMELLGIRLEPPVPARVDVTLRLSAPQPQTITIPRGTEVATLRTETQEAINFTTSQDLVILVPGLVAAMTTPDEAAFTDYLPSLSGAGTGFSVFKPVPEENNALYLGHKEDLSGQALLLNIDCTLEGIGVDPRHPPLAWEYWDGDQRKWLAPRAEADTTGGLNKSGYVILHLPYTCALREVNGKQACWVRCRAIKPAPGQRAYAASPRVRSITSHTIGGTVPATHCLRATGEALGRSSGLPGQKYTLHNTPVLSREPGETLEVESQAEGEYEPWQEVSDFSASGPEDPHFTLDSVSGEIEFGPVIRQPTGEERQYGKIPPAERQVRFTVYRSGGGVVGNVGERTITVLKSSIPYIASVTSFKAAYGGLDAETLERAKIRVPEVLKSRTRAVTTDDFEYLAREASERVARAKCVSAGTGGEGHALPGTVRLLLVPQVPQGEGPIPDEELQISKKVHDEVQDYLDERRLLATQLQIDQPRYQPVAVAARIRARASSDAASVVAEVERGLYRYINPISGGPDGKGWPFGRSLSLSEVYAIIQRAPGLDYVEEVRLFPVDPRTKERREAVSKVSIPTDGLLCSHQHEVVAIKEA